MRTGLRWNESAPVKNFHHGLTISRVSQPFYFSMVNRLFKNQIVSASKNTSPPGDWSLLARCRQTLGTRPRIALKVGVENPTHFVSRFRTSHVLPPQNTGTTAFPENTANEGSLMIDIHTLYGKTPYGQNYSFEAVLQGMERFGVDYALISSLKAAYYSGPESEAEVLAVCREHPKLLPVAGIDLRNNFSPEKTVFRLKSAGFVAARFFTEINHISLDTPLFRELAAAAEALHFPLLADAPAGMVSAALRPMGPLTVPIILLSQSAYDNYGVLGAMRERKNL